MIYGNDPNQLQALQDLGPETLRVISPELADYLYGDDTEYGGGAVGDYGDDDLLPREKKKRRPWPIILPPFPIPPDEDQPPPPFQPDPGEMTAWWCEPDACDVCQDNAADPPRPYGEPFSSGDVSPPAHDHCRCGLVSGIRSDCPIHGYRSKDRVFELSSRY